MLTLRAQHDVVFFLSRAGAGVLVVAAVIERSGIDAIWREVGRKHVSLAQAKRLVDEVSKAGARVVLDPSVSFTATAAESSIVYALAAAQKSSAEPVAQRVVSIYADPSIETRDAVLSYQKTRGPNA